VGKTKKKERIQKNSTICPLFPIKRKKFGVGTWGFTLEK
jgi:hypothetical protein